MKQFITHPFPPFYYKDSTVLILGSFPSVKSREQKFFYGHPQNRFWRVTSGVFGCAEPHTLAEKREFLANNHIALWDVIASCEIKGSSDSSITNVTANDLSPILSQSNIRQIFTNGKTAHKFYEKYTQSSVNRNAICLPSTSPANAAWSVDSLIKAWNVIICPR
ncbi:MAG: DNA-deoxyinosine glycosylase [Clostridia bacterium]|nr:DNA-deoxyinosine glycosylase [Clostridia bacterium]